MFTSYLMSNPCRMNVRSFKTLPHIAMGLNASQLHRILPSGMFDAFSTTTSACPPRLSKHRRLYMSHDMEGWSCRLWIFNDILLHFACITFNALGKLHSYTVTPICCRHGAEKSLQTSCTRISHDMSVNMIHDPTPGCKAGHPSSHPIGTSIGPRTTRLLDSQDLNRTWATRIEAHAWIILEHLWMSSESSVRFEDDNIPPPPFCLHKPEAETTTALRHLPLLFQVRKRQTATYALFNLDGCVIQLRSCHPCPSTGLNFWRRYWIHCSRKKEHHCPPNISAFWPPLGFFLPHPTRDASKSGCVALCRYLPPMRLKDYLLGCGQKRQKT